MAVELRDFGDKRTVVVFTDENRIVSRLRDRKSLIKAIPYEQEQYSKKRIALVGWDFYFPQSEKKRLLKLGTVAGCEKS